MTTSTGLRATILIALMSACDTHFLPAETPEITATEFCVSPDSCHMPGLARSTVPVVFKGLSQKSPDTISAPGELKTVENQYVRRGGASGFEFVKRHGLTTLATLPSASGYHLDKYQGALVARDRSTLFNFSPGTGAFEPAAGLSLPALTIGRRSVVSQSLATSSQISTTQISLDVAYAGNIACYVWQNGFTEIDYLLSDSASGAPLASGRLVGTTTTAPHVVALGNTFYVFYFKLSGLSIAAKTINALTFAVSGETVIAASTNANQIYDVQAGWAANRIAIIYLNSISTATTIALLDPSFAVVTSVTDSTAANQPNANVGWLSQASTPSTSYGDFGDGLLYYATVNGSAGAKLQTISQTTLANSATVSLPSVTGAINVTGLVVGTTPTLIYELTAATQNNHRLASSVGTGVRSLGLGSKVFFLDKGGSNGATPFLLATYGSPSGVVDGQDTYFVCPVTAGNVGKPTAKILGGLAAGAPTSRFLGQAAIDPAGAAHVVGQNRVSASEFGISDISVALSGTEIGRALDAQNVLTIPSGQTWEYDAGGDATTALHEAGFALFPEPVSLTNNGVGGGSVPAGTFSYVQTYEWLDRSGNLARSAPSSPTAVTVAAANSTVTVTGDNLRVSPRPYTRVVYWRTPANGTGDIYFRVSPPSAIAFDSADTNTFVDTISDAFLAGNEPLYTSSAGAGELPHVAPPASNVLVEHKGRTFGVSAEEPHIIFFSNPYVPGDAVSFNLANKLITPQATGAVTAMASMDGHLIVFKRDAVYVVDGDFPDATGGGPSIPEATPNPAAFGTVEPSSLLFTDLGIIYHSTQNGFWLLDRSLTTSYIGANIDDTARGVTVTSAVLTSDETQARFTTSQGTTFVLDLYFARQGNPIWSTWTGQAAVGAVNLAGIWYLLTAAGVLKKEDLATFADDGVAFVRKLALDDISFAGINGFYRVWRGHLLGEWKGAHAVHMTVVDSRIPANVDTFDFDATVQPQPYELEFRLRYQKGTAKTVTITDGAGSTTEGSAWTGLTFLVGAKTGLYRMPQTSTMTPE